MTTYGVDGCKIELEPLSSDAVHGLEIAAFICRMYGEGDVWAEAIESYGEQERARYWMSVEGGP